METMFLVIVLVSTGQWYEVPMESAELCELRKVEAEYQAKKDGREFFIECHTHENEKEITDVIPTKRI